MCHARRRRLHNVLAHRHPPCLRSCDDHSRRHNRRSRHRENPPPQRRPRPHDSHLYLADFRKTPHSILLSPLCDFQAHFIQRTRCSFRRRNHLRRGRKLILQRDSPLLSHDMRFYVRNALYAPNGSFIRHKQQFNASFGDFRTITPKTRLRRFDSRGYLHHPRILAQNRQRPSAKSPVSHQETFKVFRRQT